VHNAELKEEVIEVIAGGPPKVVTTINEVAAEGAADPPNSFLQSGGMSLRKVSRMSGKQMDAIPTSSGPQNDAVTKYQEMHDRRSPEELGTLAQIKRFMERHTADARFREALSQSMDAPRRVTESYGIRLDPRQALPLFQPDHSRFRFTEEEGRWPLAKLWDDYFAEMLICREAFRQTGNCAVANPRFHAWRQRQVRRCKGELGCSRTGTMTHPILAFELSAGCSVGCWFCGISADSLHDNFRYTEENSSLWRSILEQAIDLFGDAAQTGFCYWATDPADNPDYPKFIEDFFLATGNLPQTTTAAPLRNPDFTRAVLQLSNRLRCSNTRFSILTLKTLDAVHKAFTAGELLRVDLVLQNRESLTAKAVAGRAKKLHERLKDPEKLARMASSYDDESTIACVSGFLTNMVNGTIQLITPTRASDRWPLGYRIYGERRFRTVKEFRAALEDLIAAHIREEIAGDDLLAFRDDLDYQGNPEGFELRNAHCRFALGGFVGAGKLGDLIHEGHRTGNEIQAALVRAAADVFAVADALQKLYEAGLLNEDPKCDGIRSDVRGMATVA